LELKLHQRKICKKSMDEKELEVEEDSGKLTIKALFLKVHNRLGHLPFSKMKEWLKWEKLGQHLQIVISLLEQVACMARQQEDLGEENYQIMRMNVNVN
jgi:hypothetical protein